MHTGRRMGKTYEAIKNAAETGSYILVPNAQRAQHVAKQAEEMGLNIRYPVTLAELQRTAMHTGFVKNLTIDDLDEILCTLFPYHKIEMVTITAEPHKSQASSEQGEKMKDVMLDFETLGNGKHACIIQIGAVYFDRKTGKITKTFKCNVDARSSVKSGADLDADTVYWWLSQSKEAIESVTKGELLPITIAMHNLNEFLSEADAIWSHATFDFVILTETLKRLSIPPKFHYATARDIRTLVDLGRIDKKQRDKLVRQGVHHDALADCEFQVKYCVMALNKLNQEGIA